MPILADVIHCAVKFIQKTLRGPPASLCIPISRRTGFFERSGMDWQGLDAHHKYRLLIGQLWSTTKDRLDCPDQPSRWCKSHPALH
jgi:hypothetical protein